MEVREIVLGFMGLIGIFAVLSFGIYFIRSTLRRKRMESLANLLGFSFEKKGDDIFLSELKRFSLFSKGHAKKVRNIVCTDSNVRKLAIFNYSYRTTNTYSTETPGTINLFEHTVFYCSLKNKEILQFSIRPKKFGDKAQVDPSFSKHYIFQTNNKSIMFEIFPSSVLEFFQKEKNWGIQVQGNKIILYKKAYLGMKTLVKAHAVFQQIVDKI